MLIIGIISTFYAWKIKVLRKHNTYILFAFYTIMELLQTIQYSLVNKCGDRANYLLTEFAYILVIVQPFLWNLIFYSHVSKMHKKIFMVAIIICIIWMMFNIASRSPYFISKYGYSTDAMSDPIICTKREERGHLYWQWSQANFHGFNANWLMYLAIWFVPCLVVQETRLTGIILVIGASIGALLTIKYANPLEFASTWCYISIPMMCCTFLKHI